MQRLAIVGLAILAIWPMPSASAQTAVEKIYAELAKLPAAERQKRIEEGARKEGKLVIIHTMRGNLRVDQSRCSRSAIRSSTSNWKATSARRTPPSAFMPRRPPAAISPTSSTWRCPTLRR